MFEHYTEQARRVIFFGRYEASQLGSPLIETEHLLIGLLREDKSIIHRFFGPNADAVRASVREQVEKRTTYREKISISCDIPLSTEGKRVLAYANEESARLSHQYIGPEHILLGLLREERSIAFTILYERGLRLSVIREELGGKKPVIPEAPETTRKRLADLLYSDCMISASQHNDEIFEAYRRGKELGDTNKSEPS